MPIGHPDGPRDNHQYVLMAAVRLKSGNDDIDRIRTFYAGGRDVVPQSIEECSSGDWEIGAPGYTYHLYYVLSQARVGRLTPQQRAEYRDLHMKRIKWSRPNGEGQQMPDDCMADISREETGTGGCQGPRESSSDEEAETAVIVKNRHGDSELADFYESDSLGHVIEAWPSTASVTAAAAARPGPGGPHCSDDNTPELIDQTTSFRRLQTESFDVVPLSANAPSDRPGSEVSPLQQAVGARRFRVFRMPLSDTRTTEEKLKLWLCS
ncbi:hypothetical protein LY76DRAFT_643832 [Colletotrichum caudatum]|nr:hypothetical protein LY76DRAFT_643832 [Colletotrichum caudatum]